MRVVGGIFQNNISLLLLLMMLMLILLLFVSLLRCLLLLLYLWLHTIQSFSLETTTLRYLV